MQFRPSSAQFRILLHHQCIPATAFTIQVMTSMLFSMNRLDFDDLIDAFGLKSIALEQVNCNKPYWFDVSVTLNQTRTLSAGSELLVYCDGSTIYANIGDDDVCEIIIMFTKISAPMSMSKSQITPQMPLLCHGASRCCLVNAHKLFSIRS